ncbi:MAG: response regulator transcription factor [Coprococcus sp.]
MRLLFAEDEKSLSRAITAILKKNHYEVDAVYDGEEALAYLECGTYDGAILDIMMPKKDGLTVLKEIRRQGINTPVLMLTAKAEIDDRVLGLDSGANDYLTKPFAAPELLARIRAMTRTQMTQNTSSLSFGNLSLNQTSFELSSPSGSYQLTNKEFQLLELLMANPGQVISSDRLFEKIWGYESDADPSVIWVYISYLRKKLTALNASVRIRAIRNAGYRLEEIQ